MSNENINTEKLKHIHGPGSKFIKMDSRSRNNQYYDKFLKYEQKITAIKGTLVYLLIFIILIPYLLYKLGFHMILKLYFVNTDLIATVISFDKGYFKHFFKYLYNDTGPLIGYLSQALINWSVLMGLFYIILSDNCKKPISYSLGRLAFILLITYLLPSRYLIKIQNETYNFLTNKMFTKKSAGLMTILLGLILVILLIGFEGLVVNLFSDKLKKIIDYLFKII